MADKGTELTITKPIGALTQLSLTDIRDLGGILLKSGFFSDIKEASQAMVKIIAGQELGLPAIYSMQNINLIRDRLTTSANTMAMLVKKSGKYNYRIKEHTDLICAITFFEDGKEVGVSSFTMEDAKRANLVKPDSGWVKFPRAMLFSRAISQGARIYAPDAIGGVYTDEEIRSIPPRPEEDKITSEPDLKQAEQDSRDYFPPGGTEPLPDAPESPKKAGKEKTSSPAPTKSLIEPDWLTEQLKILEEKSPEVWNETNILSFMKNTYKVKGETVLEAVAKLDAGKAKHFAQRIQEGLDKKEKGVS